MLLDRIDIDAHGPLSSVELGPFAEHLNVVCGPPGSGKTAISRFIRDSLCHRRYPLGMLSSSTGRVVWAAADGLVHCRREKDGTAEGRRSVEFESRGDHRLEFTPLDQSWMSGATSTTDSSRAIRSIQVPESIVDCVITDTSITNVARVVSACVRAGIDNAATYQGLPLDDHHVGRTDDFFAQSSVEARQTSDRSRSLRAELADVEAELSRMDSDVDPRASLVARREAIIARLHEESSRPRYGARSVYPERVYVDPIRDNHLRNRLIELSERADRLRAREEQLQYWIADIDRESYSFPASNHSQTTLHEPAISAAARRRLDDLNAQLIRLRRALSEVRALKSLMTSRRDDYSTAFDEQALRRRRFEGFSHAIDHYDYRSGWDRFYGEAYKPLHAIDDINVRIEAATRQIDWLLNRYAVVDSASDSAMDWYATLPPALSYGDATTIADTLRAIRNDLDHVRVDNRFVDQHSESWLVGAIDHLVRHRNAILDDATRNSSDRGYLHSSDLIRSAWGNPNWSVERSERIAEIQRTHRELDACLSEAADVRRQMRQLPVVEPVSTVVRDASWIDRDSLHAELRDIDRRLTGSGRREWLTRRRVELLDALRVVRRPVRTTSPLADHASRWLVRLSAGRLTRLDWSNVDHHGSHVRINGREETQCSDRDRSLAVLAVRMAAGDLLAKTGRGVPLVIETAIGAHDAAHGAYSDSHIDRHWDSTAWALRQHGMDGRSNNPLAAALFDYSRAGRQVLVLTESQSLADEMVRVGGRAFRLHAEKIAHAHRPIWRSEYRTEHYVGPHSHTNGYDNQYAYDHIAMDHESHINRDFDVAWREAYGMYDVPASSREYASRASHDNVTSVAPTDWARDGVEHRDGYYYGNRYTTSRVDAGMPVATNGSHFQTASESTGASLVNAGRQEAAQRPFFLTVDSPIDQAPSIDSVAAARLRGLSITHITHLMRQDSNRLADALGLVNVDAATIRRWQNECRLVCRVPQLRGFDARILVGCGITDPAQLAAIHPNDLLLRVQTFLATERGQQILLSGTSYELSRITRWIASANRSVKDSVGGVVVDGKRVSARLVRDADEYDSDRYEIDRDGVPNSESGTRRRRIIRTHHADGRVTVTSDDEFNRQRDQSRSKVQVAGSSARSASNTTTAKRGSADATRNHASSSHEAASRSDRGSRKRRSERASGSATTRTRESHTPRESDRRSENREVRVTSDREAHGERESTRRESNDSSTSLRFYLHRESPIVDAPSIGPRMAERLAPFGLYTVDDLLNADSAQVAADLNHRRIDESVVRSWQHQAELVCRVPMLRGHDAQILVAAGVTDAEELAGCDPRSLLHQVEPICNSRDGKRILRGGSVPDLKEVTQWIGYAAQHRELLAA